MMIKTGKLFLLPGVFFVLLSASCVPSSLSTGKSPPAWIQSSLQTLAGASSQVLLVTAEEPSGFKATLHALAKRDGVWRYALPPTPALIGKKGFAPPGGKKEGDGRTPSGVFALKRAFGYGAAIDSRMPYRQAGREDIWVDDPSSPDYNRWVRMGETRAASFEVMKRPDDRYTYGIVIEYNTDPVIPGAGSAIFIHVRGGQNVPTLGCVALPESDILKVLGWLDPATEPLAILGTRESLPALNKGPAGLASFPK
jgi:L,D-peptidoglycan transpeptidase YkuD (ErfK/YbiS/YcfS/YnhG family)